MTRPRVLFVAPVEPWCRENGSSLIIADLLEGLARIERADILPVFVRQPPPGYDRKEPPGMAGVLLDIPGLPRWRSVARALLRGSSPLRMRFNNGQVARRILEVMRERDFHPEVVHVEHLPLVDIGIQVSKTVGAPLVYRAHNVESQLWARRLGMPDMLKNRVLHRMEKLEAAAAAASDLTLCISRGDLAWVRRHAPKARAELLPCTLLLDRYDVSAGHAPRRESRVCFVGGLDWAPNRAGLSWFVREVLPQVVSEVPDATLAVLARGAGERPWLRDHPAVRILEPETSAATLFASSRVSIAPLFEGGGVRIKIPESLALGCPVVATRIGAEGHELPGVTSTDDPRRFAEACIRHLAEPVGVSMHRSLHEAVEALHGAPGLAEKLVEMWTSLLPFHGASDASKDTLAFQ